MIKVKWIESPANSVKHLWLQTSCLIWANINITGHIQISQIPDRHEPNDDGTINFTSFFKKIKEVGYDGYVAGEYYAAGMSEKHHKCKSYTMTGTVINKF